MTDDGTDRIGEGCGGDPDDLLLVFLHLPKTGGTTLSDVLRRHYPPAERFDHESYAGSLMPLASLPEAMAPRIRCLMGHYYHGAHARFPGRPFSYVTMLRDPIERVLSHYSFVRTYPGYEFLRGKTFSEYLDLAAEATNGQAAQLFGGDPQRPERARTESVDFDVPENLERARTNLRACAAVGLTERFDDSLALFARTFGWPHTGYAVANVTANRLRREDVSAADLRKAEARNRADLELYALAEDLFARQLAGG